MRLTVRRGERRKKEDAGGSLGGPKLPDAETIMGSAAESHNPIELGLLAYCWPELHSRALIVKAGRALMDGGVSLAEVSRGGTRRPEPPALKFP